MGCVFVPRKGEFDLDELYVFRIIEGFSGAKITDNEVRKNILSTIKMARFYAQKAKSICYEKSRTQEADKLRVEAVRLVYPIYKKMELSFEAISYFLNVSTGSLCGWFKKAELKANSNRPRNPYHPTIYSCDETAFDNWGPEMAYWLGFIWADGYARDSMGRYYLRVVVSDRDREHLELFKNFLKTDVPIKSDFVSLKNGGPSYPVAVITINRKKIVRALQKHNVISFRSANEIEFPYIPSEYFWDFIRGYFDGDGAIYRNQDCKFPLSGWVCTFSGSKTNVEFIRNEIINETGVVFNLGRNGRSEVNYCISRTGPAIIQVIRRMYSVFDGPSLKRKFTIAQELMFMFDIVSVYGVKISGRGDGVRFCNTKKVPESFNILMSQTLFGGNNVDYFDLMSKENINM